MDNFFIYKFIATFIKTNDINYNPTDFLKI